MTKRGAGAFTLLEMIVVLVIAALVIGVGASAVSSITGEHELLRVAHEGEAVLMQAMTRTLTTGKPQAVVMAGLGQGAKLMVRHAGSDTFEAVEDQRVWLRPGGLCEPLTLRWQKGTDWVSATLDPLTAAFNDLEENL